MHTIGAGAWLKELDESIIGREGGGRGIAHRGYLLSTIALLVDAARHSNT